MSFVSYICTKEIQKSRIISNTTLVPFVFNFNMYFLIIFLIYSIVNINVFTGRVSFSMFILYIQYYL